MPEREAGADTVHITPAGSIRGELFPPGDKSISHRAVIFLSLATGTARVRNFLFADDCLRTVAIMEKLGADIVREGDGLVITGRGLRDLTEPDDVLFCGNSGTTIRLMLGVLAGTGFFSVLSGDESLSRRPMGRVTEPLSRMGAVIRGRENGRFPPLAVIGADLKGEKFDLTVSSAQVKTALLFAGMRAEGTTRVREPSPSRDHTERMMDYFDITLSREGEGWLAVEAVDGFDAKDIEVAGDLSSSAPFITAALIVPNSELIIRNVGLNPGRVGILEVLTAMGGDITVENRRDVSGEIVGDLVVRSSELSGITIDGEMIPRVIDEIPVLATAAAYAAGETRITGAGELRVKESDRIATMVMNLRTLGIDAEELSDGMIIPGGGRIEGGEVDSFGDHRIVLAGAVAGMVSRKGVTISNASSVTISYPEFFDHLRVLSHPEAV
ncbi:MAG: 3-phosphoshikimate 1-carboxyvinyltransferase [Deltaproteobacteria bacterium]|nr:3-phosphoshikimate 1-carboxyvinyltransferase [Candidatus Zymogenaceae bacterium]